jgi:hypothetical protein
MANAYLNNAAIGQSVLKNLRKSWAPILSYAYDISGDSMMGQTSVTVPVATNSTGAEYTTTSTGYTAEDVTLTGITVTPTILYATWSMNDLERMRNPTNPMRIVQALTNGVASQAFTKMNAVVTAANFATSSTITAANFDADDLADLAVTLTKTKKAQMERVAILAPDYYGNLVKDNEISAAYASGTTSVILDNTIARVRGFGIHEVDSIAAGANSLGSWVSDNQALVVVARMPDTINAGDVTNITTVVDEASGLPLSLVERYSNGNWSLTASILFGVAKGTDTLVRITTA